MKAVNEGLECCAERVSEASPQHSQTSKMELFRKIAAFGR